MPPETAKIIHHDIFWFFLHDQEFLSKTINDGYVDLETFPASRLKQLAMRMEILKATVKHTKQVAGDPQVAQINLMRHQCTELSSGKHKKKKPFVTSRQQSHKNAGNKNQQVFSHYKKIQPMWKAFSALGRIFRVKIVTSLDILLVFAMYNRVTNHRPDRSSQNAIAQSGAWGGRQAIPECASQTGYPRVQFKYALDKRGYRSPNTWTSRAPLRRTH